MAVVGVAFILTGTGILKKRNAAVTALLASTTSLFNDYRGRVIADQGKEKDREYYTGIKKIKEKVTIDGEEGATEIEVEKEVQLDSSVGDCPLLSPYAIKVTSENCRNFERLSGDKLYVEHWLQTMQEMNNTHGHTDGIVYLDWVLDELGIKLDETNPSLNAFIAHNVGWIFTDYYYDACDKSVHKNEGDKYIDFGCWNDDGSLALISGKDGSVYLDFNVDGWINGRLPRKNADHLRKAIEDHPEIER